MDNRYNLSQFEASFREFLVTEQVSAPTLKNYLSDLRHFSGWLMFFLHTALKGGSGADVFAHITPAVIESYKTYLLENKIPAKTINRRLSTLRKFFSFAITQGWTHENAAKQVANISFNAPAEPAPQIHTVETAPAPDPEPILTVFEADLTRKHGEVKTVSLIIADVREFLKSGALL